MENILKSERFFRAIFNSVTDAVSIIDPDFRIVEVNEAFLKIYGFCSKEEVIGKTCCEITHGRTASCAPCPMEAVLATGTSATIEHIHCSQDGERYVEISFFPMAGEEGEEYVIHIARDITERKKAENARKQITSQLQQALDEVRVLEGLLPICAACKKIRNDRGEWESFESYISDRSQATFTHGLCQNCIPKYFPPKE